MGVWRDGVAEEVGAYLRDGMSVNLVGPRGSGRSHVVKQVTELLVRHGYTVVSCAGVAAFRERPLAALAVAGIEVPSAAAASTISGAVQALASRLQRGPAVLVVDDADDLDAVSTGVVTAAFAGGDFALLTVMRQAGQRDEIARRLVIDITPGVRITLDPLRFDQMHLAMHDLLPGQIDPSGMAQLATLSGGVPRVLQAIVDAGRRSGAIVEDDGVWRVEGALWNSRLASVADRYLGDLTDDELDALTRLAVAGPVLGPQAQDMVPREMLEQLLALGAVQSVETPAGVQIGVFPPLVGEFLRRTQASLDWPLGVDASRSRPAGPMLTDARALLLNRLTAEHWQAEVDARRDAWLAKPNIENAVALLTAMHGVAVDRCDTTDIFEVTDVTDADPVWLARFVGWKAVCIALRGGDLAGAHALLVEHEQATPRFESYLRALDGLLMILSGQVPGDELFEGLPLDQHHIGVDFFDAVRRLALALRGRTADALSGLQRRPSLYPYFSEVPSTAMELAHIMHGDFDGGIRWATMAMEEAENRLSPGEIQAHAYMVALGLAFSGRLEQLPWLLGAALLIDNTALLYKHYQASLLQLSSSTARWLGRRGLSQSLTAQAEMLGQGMWPEVGSSSTGNDAGPDEVGTKMWAGVDRLFASGHIAAGVVRAAAVVELWPDAGAAKAAVEHARCTQSPFLAALGGYVAAVAAADPVALGESVAELRRLGAWLHAVRAAITRSIVLRQRGDMTAAISQAQEAWEMAQGLGESPDGLFRRLAQAVGLTEREREVGRLLADGMAPQGIATKLGISLRTVENYLSNAYRKLGSEGRADLAQAVSTWAKDDAEG